ncbi:MAG: hypothetical protein ACYSTY_07160 [Planctomycetota bacterium]|jgi:hypothetical protein
MNELEEFIWLAGLLHFGVLIASALVPQVLDWKRELARLSTMTRQLVWVHGSFIVLVIVAFGTLSLLHPADLASGAPLSRTICGCIAVFWAARLSLQFLLFDPTPLLKKAALKVGYHGPTVVFAYFSAVYGWASIAPA